MPILHAVLQYFFFTPGAILIDIIQLLTYPRQSLWVILMFASVLAKLAGEPPCCSPGQHWAVLL